MESSKTKEKIMNAAIKLFSDNGYDKVSMRDIAGEVGIKAASIYNHFPSKEDILKSIYKLYADEYRLTFPKRDETLRQIETESIHDVLNKLNYHWPPDLQDKMTRIIIIAGQRMCLDKDSENFVNENFLKPQKEIWKPLLEKAVELRKIEPIDIDTFIRLVMYYALSVSGLNRTVMKITNEEWNSGLNMIFSLLKPIQQ
jgi:AcrR family transcriptional regulator